MSSARTRRVRIGIQVAPQHVGYPAIRDAVARLEDAGVDAIFNWDHFFPLTGDPDGAHYEAWTTLAAIAEQTTRVEFGPLVNCTSFRNADLQADMARTIDHISAHATGEGRFIYGTGSGWFERDFVDYGYDFATPGERIDRLAHDLPRIRSRWQSLNPAPTRKIPILIGGGGERKTLRLVAEHADIWHTFAEPDLLVHKIGVLRHWCEEIGRDPDEIEIASGTSVRGLGSLDRGVLETQYELGVRFFIGVVRGPDFVDSELQALLDWRESIEG